MRVREKIRAIKYGEKDLEYKHSSSSDSSIKVIHTKQYNKNKINYSVTKGKSSKKYFFKSDYQVPSIGIDLRDYLITVIFTVK